MDTDIYQEFTKSTAIYPENKALEYLSLGMTSEAGEVAGKVKKFIRDGNLSPKDVVKEIGDVLWYCARLSDELGYTMSEVLVMNRDKLVDRNNRDMIKGSGDER